MEDPKKNRNPFQFFSNAKKDEVASCKTLGDRSKLLSEMWKKVSNSDKEQYEAQAAEAKINYQKELAKWQADHPAVSESESEDSDDHHKSGRKKKKRKQERDPNAPKRPLTSYFSFVADIRDDLKKENPDLSVPQLNSLASKKWKDLNPVEKSKYADAYQKLLADWKVKNLEYKAGKEKSSSSSSKKPEPDSSSSEAESD